MLESTIYRIPTYQRRYAWGIEQWVQLLSDTRIPNHHMGQVTVYEVEGMYIVADGQQRLTSLLLILASIRIVAYKSNQMELVQRIDELLFCDQSAFDQWHQKNSQNLQDSIKEGDFLEFFRLIPTYTDRRSFYLSVLDLDMSFKNESLVSKAREFFVSTLLKTDIEQTLESITD